MAGRADTASRIGIAFNPFAAASVYPKRPKITLSPPSLFRGNYIRIRFPVQSGVDGGVSATVEFSRRRAARDWKTKTKKKNDGKKNWNTVVAWDRAIADFLSVVRTVTNTLAFRKTRCGYQKERSLTIQTASTAVKSSENSEPNSSRNTNGTICT